LFFGKASPKNGSIWIAGIVALLSLKKNIPLSREIRERESVRFMLSRLSNTRTYARFETREREKVLYIY
jgi:hypothetical protein